MTHREIRPETVHDSDAVYPAVIRVTTREELTKALRERKQVIIGDKKLARPFERLLWAQKYWWVPLAAILADYAISQEYQVKFTHTEWRTGVTTQDEIVLRPTRR
jgi:hypothetical protein